MTDVLPPPVAPQPDLAPTNLLADQPRKLASRTRADTVEVVVAVVAGISVSFLLCLLLDWRHPATFGIWAVIGTLGVQWLLARDRLGPTAAIDRFMTALVWVAAMAAVGILAWLIVFLAAKGLTHIKPQLFTEDMSKSGPLDPTGGAWHAIVGTLQQTAIATVVAVPLGILTAVYLHELKGRISPVVRFVSDAMSGLPSIVAGLFILTLWVRTGNPLHGQSGIAAAAALVIVMLPIVTRTSEEILRTVDNGLRESALALGSPEWRTVLKIVLPTARAGLVTASILGVARIIGETAPLILAAGGSSSVNYNPFSGPQSALPLYVYELIKQPFKAQNDRAWAAAVVLVVLVLVLFVAARVISSRGTKKLGARR